MLLVYFLVVFRIREILRRIRILGSVHWITVRFLLKIFFYFFPTFFSFLLVRYCTVHIHQSTMIMSHKEVPKVETVEIKFKKKICLFMEGSDSESGSLQIIGTGTDSDPDPSQNFTDPDTQPDSSTR
jgi:hypothetical protein